MKKILSFLLVVSLFLLTQGITAQRASQSLNGNEMEERIEKQVQKLGQELELDNLQKALLKANLKEFNTKALEILKVEDSREDLQEAIKSLRKKQKEELSVFLNDSQIKVFEQFQKKEQKRNRSALRRNRIRY